MAEEYKLFDSTEEDERWYSASDFAAYFSNVLSSGLLHTNNVPALRVSVGDGLTTKLSVGKAIIKGFSYQNTTVLDFTHAIPNVGMSRIDRIVLRLDLRPESRYIRAFVKKGEESKSPVAPTLQRDNYIYELSLAQLKITYGDKVINPLTFIDERFNENLCGLVSSLITVPTSEFQSQWDYWFSAQKGVYVTQMLNWLAQQQQLFTDWRNNEVQLFTDWRSVQQSEFEAWRNGKQTAFTTWFNEVKDTLSEDAAGNLFLRITSELPLRFTKNGVNYRYGFTVTDDFNGLIFKYEQEV
ncbi:hypothetical protein [Candidatus Kurthia intestinigallinarum]|uniref:hypothetical protein n=1 Tax=Candidatus Kurthia intestinigallinarum TaxID=1562256 RepID=UPI000F8C42C9|nr:hypothetical protein [Kurthia sp. 3B1D]